MRNFLRTRKQLVRERSGHIQRIQKTLEDANIKLDSVITDIVGLSGRAMIEALMADASIAEVWGTVRVACGLPYDPFRVLESPFAAPRP